MLYLRFRAVSRACAITSMSNSMVFRRHIISINIRIVTFHVRAHDALDAYYSMCLHRYFRSASIASMRSHREAEIEYERLRFHPARGRHDSTIMDILTGDADNHLLRRIQRERPFDRSNEQEPMPSDRYDSRMSIIGSIMRSTGTLLRKWPSGHRCRPPATDGRTGPASSARYRLYFEFSANSVIDIRI